MELRRYRETAGWTVFGAAAMLGMGHVIVETTDFSEVPQAEVRACAAQLGEVAVRSDSLPDSCSDEDLEYRFGYETTTIDRFDPHGTLAGETVSKKIVYLLPSRQDFLEDDQARREAVDNRRKTNKKLPWFMTGVSIPLFMVMLRPRRSAVEQIDLIHDQNS